MNDETKTIEETLREVTKVTQKKGEDRPGYLVRMIEACQDLKDDVWEALPEDAQLWVNAGAKKLKANKPPDDFPTDEEEPEAEESEEAAEGEPEEETAEEPAEEGEAEEPEEKKPEKKAKAVVRKPRAEGEKSAQIVIRELVLENPKISAADLNTKLSGLGYEVSNSTITTTKAAFTQSVRVLQEANLLKRKIL